jgi:hypothetical protein
LSFFEHGTFGEVVIVVYTLYVVVFLLFLELRLVFDFYLDMRSDLVIYFHQGVFLPLVLIGFHQKSWIKRV